MVVWHNHWGIKIKSIRDYHVIVLSINKAMNQLNYIFIYLFKRNAEKMGGFGIFQWCLNFLKRKRGKRKKRKKMWQELKTRNQKEGCGMPISARWKWGGKKAKGRIFKRTMSPATCEKTDPAIGHDMALSCQRLLSTWRHLSLYFIPNS